MARSTVRHHAAVVAEACPAAPLLTVAGLILGRYDTDFGLCSQEASQPRYAVKKAYMLLLSPTVTSLAALTGYTPLNNMRRMILTLICMYTPTREGG